MASRSSDGAADNAASFGSQWAGFDYTLGRTWGGDAADRLAGFLVDVGRDPTWFRDKRVLDAGCGNGILTAQIGSLACEAVGIDISRSVYEAQRRFPGVTFRQADLLALPHDLGRFDVIYSGGVLHHTPDTRRALEQLVQLLLPGGRIYVWLYHELGTHAYRFKRRLRHGPLWWRRSIAAPFALQGWLRDRTLTLPEHYLIQHDFFTPRWRWEHTPDEVEQWFTSLGLRCQKRTMSPDGFGVLAELVSADQNDESSGRNAAPGQAPA
jgi:SAM-dependent methyltransferase